MAIKTNSRVILRKIRVISLMNTEIQKLEAFMCKTFVTISRDTDEYVSARTPSKRRLYAVLLTRISVLLMSIRFLTLILIKRKFILDLLFDTYYMSVKSVLYMAVGIIMFANFCFGYSTSYMEINNKMTCLNFINNLKYNSFNYPLSSHRMNKLAKYLALL